MPVLKAILNPLDELGHLDTRRFFPLILCRDNTTLYVRASVGHCCTPRDNIGPYTEVEVTQIDIRHGRAVMPKSWEQYSNHPTAYPQDARYYYVPIALVREFIAKHGGEFADANK